MNVLEEPIVIELVILQSLSLLRIDVLIIKSPPILDEVMLDSLIPWNVFFHFFAVSPAGDTTTHYSFEHLHPLLFTDDISFDFIHQAFLRPVRHQSPADIVFLKAH